MRSHTSGTMPARSDRATAARRQASTPSRPVPARGHPSRSAWSAIAGDACVRFRALRPGDEPPPHKAGARPAHRSEEHTSELQSRFDLVCRLLLEKKKKQTNSMFYFKKKKKKYK